MFKSLLFATVVALGAFMVGCTKPYSIEQTSYGVPVSSGQANFGNMIVGQNLKLSSLCWNNCEKGWIFEMPIYRGTYEGSYTLPLSEKLELDVGITIIMEFDRSGGRDAIVQRLKEISQRYAPTHQVGDAGGNMALYWNIASIASFDLPDSKVKSITRPILAMKTLDQAADELAALGPIVTDIENGLKQHLKDIGSTLVIREVQFHKIDLPSSVKDKNTQNYNLKAQEEIQKKQLEMRERRILTTHKLNLIELSNEIELDSLLQPTLTPSKIAYKWVQTANLFGENGIPFAVSPEMLAPAAGKAYESSYDTDKIKETIQRKLSQIDQQIQSEQACEETDNGCKK